jgi:hypothetical protein
MSRFRASALIAAAAPALSGMAMAVALIGAPAVAMAPAVVDPATIAGTWSLTSGDKVCHLSLGISKTEDGEAYTVDLGDCVEAGLPRLRGWTAEADGIGLQLDGGVVLFMAKEEVGRFTGQGHDGRQFILARNR